MTKVVWVELETFKVRMSAHCGMGYDVATNLSYREALQHAAAFARKRARAGYLVMTYTVADGEAFALELSEPEDAMMVPDDAGILEVSRELERGRECWMCGCPARVDQPCCETDEQDEYSEAFS